MDNLKNNLDCFVDYVNGITDYIEQLKQLDKEYMENPKQDLKAIQIAETRKQFIKRLSKQVTETVTPVIKELEQYKKRGNNGK